ncbi:MAG TPA: hypothetical protein VFS00_33515 [Polyangiaceae bacterium]|nr:hypothetical protein [Polyangiaceae bacterium]
MLIHANLRVWSSSPPTDEGWLGSAQVGFGGPRSVSFCLVLGLVLGLVRRPV